MSEVERIAIHGRFPPTAMKQRLEKRKSRIRALRQEKARKPEKPEDFVSYEESEDEDEGISLENKYLRTSYNFIDYLRSREMGMKEKRSVNSDFPSRHILSHEMFRERPIFLNNINKIFCSKWLSDRQVVFGTKCNKLMVYDVVTQKVDQIPLLRESPNLSNQDQQHGIQTVQINPSRTLLATGARNTLDIAIYRLPTMDPVCVGESHKDWVYDVCWLDDQFLVSGSKDNKLGLWKIVDEYDEDAKIETPNYEYVSAATIKACKSASKGIRAVEFNPEFQEIAALSLSGHIHIWNAERFRQMYTRKLPSAQDTTCLAVKKGGLYGIGCRSYTLLLDPRTLHPVKKIAAKFSGCGIRSASFQGDILSIGTGVAMLMFYDLRAHKYLESSINTSRTVNLKSSRGYVFPDEQFMDGMPGANKYSPAIYTHCFDFTGTRLFAGGGPLPTHLIGNYAGIYQ